MRGWRWVRSGGRVAVIMQNRGSVIGVNNDALVAQSGAPFVEYNMLLPKTATRKAKTQELLVAQVESH